MRLKLLFAVAVIFVLAGMLIDRSYQRSTPDAAYVEGIVVGFDRPHARQVYPIFEFTDANGRVHRVVNSSQQSTGRFPFDRRDLLRAAFDVLQQCRRGQRRPTTAENAIRCSAPVRGYGT
jgi:hypothetical protein